MKSVSDLTDTDLNRWIAAKVEPIPSWDLRKMHAEHWESDKGFWWRPMADAIHDYEIHDPICHNAVTDPALTITLLEKLLQRGDVDFSTTSTPDNPNRPYYCYAEDSLQSSITPYRGYGPSIGRAIAEAWALANGWKPND